MNVVIVHPEGLEKYFNNQCEGERSLLNKDSTYNHSKLVFCNFPTFLDPTQSHNPDKQKFKKLSSTCSTHEFSGKGISFPS